MKSACIFGLGYVGLPLAVLCLEKGYVVYGKEVDHSKIEKIKKEYPSILVNHPDAVKADVQIIAVPTPVDEGKYPDLSFVKVAAEEIVTGLEKSCKRLVILESTVSPFVSRHAILPIFEKKGLVEGQDFFLAHCPERIDPGNKVWNVSNIPRVVGAISKEGLERVVKFYTEILSASVFPLDSIEEAEMVKIYENSFRAVNIAFANEMAIIMQMMKLDGKNVLDAVKTKPYGLDMCKPGPGTGGHCIPVDPFYLIDESVKRGFDPSFLRTAMRVNQYMPSYAVSLLTHTLNDTGKPVKGTMVGILGVAYKKDVDDIRESPALEIIRRLERLGAVLKISDPFVPSYTNATIAEVMACDAVILVTDHSVFNSLDFSNVPVVIDTRNVLDRTKIFGVYKGIGR